eukprot:196384_1
MRNNKNQNENYRSRPKPLPPYQRKKRKPPPPPSRTRPPRPPKPIPPAHALHSYYNIPMQNKKDIIRKALDQNRNRNTTEHVSGVSGPNYKGRKPITSPSTQSSFILSTIPQHSQYQPHKPQPQQHYMISPKNDEHSLHRLAERRCRYKERTFSDVHTAFSLKKQRLSSMASHYKLSADDQRILQRAEWRLMDALKSQNKVCILKAIKNAKMEVLCNFLLFICLMLNNDEIPNVYNIHSMKKDVVMLLQNMIHQRKDLQQHMAFILSCYPHLKRLFAHASRQLDTILFWNKIIDTKAIYEGFNFKIEPQNSAFKKYVNKIMDPIMIGKGYIQLIAVKKILNSNAKPLLLDIYVKDTDDEKWNGVGYISYFTYNKLCNGVLSSQVLLKKGDDLNKDASCMLMFKFMNHLWKNENVNYNGMLINILTYKVIPISSSLGCIEIIPDCIGLRDINLIEFNCLNNLIASSAAAYISCLILGIRDRHYDNQMIRTIDYKLFHIDFNFMFGEKASLDTIELGITKQLAQIMDDKYKMFVELAVKAHQVLRMYHKELIDFASVAFIHLYKLNVIKQYISKKLRLKLNDEQAKKWLRKKLLKAPTNTQTKLKNTIHRMAVNMHSTNNSIDWD